MNDPAYYRGDMGTSARDSMDADTPDGTCSTCGRKASEVVCADCGKCRVCDCDCKYVTLAERANQNMALQIATLHEKVARLTAENTALHELILMRAPRVVTEAQRDVIAEAYWSWRRSRVMVTAPEWMNLAPGGMQKDCYELADAVVAAFAANTEPTP